ncbi:MAG: hypothetical protein JWR74_1711 [Polaromonas sp.]|jgi:Cu(I)/Ag(I) efflux system protein CusF|nr:hypothetical protein [Polaromonas sp.]
MKTIKNLLIASTFVACAASAHASSHSNAPMMKEEAGKSMPMPMAAAGMAEGEVRKIDMDSKKITIKHGEIKNLDMPGMTMVFQVKDAALLEKAKAGDKIRFRAEKSGSAIVVTDIQPVR